MNKKLLKITLSISNTLVSIILLALLLYCFYSAGFNSGYNRLQPDRKYVLREGLNKLFIESIEAHNHYRGLTIRLSDIKEMDIDSVSKIKFRSGLDSKWRSSSVIQNDSLLVIPLPIFNKNEYGYGAYLEIDIVSEKEMEVVATLKSLYCGLEWMLVAKYLFGGIIILLILLLFKPALHQKIYPFVSNNNKT